MKLTAKQKKIRAIAARCPRVIEWSNKDKCYVGSAPPLIGQCCHADNEIEVARLLADIVIDLAEDIVDGKMPVPAELANKEYSGKFMLRISPALHKATALRAGARGESLNQYVEHALAR